MMKAMRKGRSEWLFLCFVSLAMLVTGIARGADSGSRDGVFIHVSHGKEDPHRVLMALKMASIMTEDHDVLVYFDIKGIEVVLAGAGDITYDDFPSAKRQLALLREKGAVLMACPGCLKAAGKTAEDLAAGIEIADKSRFFSFTKGRILTLDY